MTRHTSMDPGLDSRSSKRSRVAPNNAPDLFSVAASSTVDAPDAWDGSAEGWRRLTDDDRRALRKRWSERLLPLLNAMRKAVPTGHGVTAAELIDEAMRPSLCSGFGIILPATPASEPRIYSFVGPWMASLAKSGLLSRKVARIEGGGTVQLKREALRDEAHSNAGLIYL